MNKLYYYAFKQFSQNNSYVHFLVRKTYNEFNHKLVIICYPSNLIVVIAMDVEII